MFSYDIELRHDGGGGPMRVLDGSVTFDTGWSPWAQGRFVVPLQDWEDADLDAFGQPRITVHVDAADDNPTRTATADWTLLLRTAREDRLAGTVELELASWELLLQETVRQGPDWLPSGLGEEVFFLDLLGRVLVEIGHGDLDTAGELGLSIHIDDVLPWRAGQSAWDFLEQYRARAAVAYQVGITPADSYAFVTLAPAAVVTTPLPSGLIAHTREVMPEQYADVLTVRWSWREAGADYEERETVYAAGLASWKNARQPVELEREGPRVAGWAQRAVNRMERHRFVHYCTLPLSSYSFDPTALRSPAWPARTYNFGDEATLTATVIREFS